MRLSISDAFTGPLDASRATAASTIDMEYIAFMAPSPFIDVTVVFELIQAMPFRVPIAVDHATAAAGQECAGA